MKEAINQSHKRCPICKKDYPEADTYCGDDGSALELLRDTSTKHSSKPMGMPTIEALRSKPR